MSQFLHLRIALLVALLMLCLPPETANAQTIRFSAASLQGTALTNPTSIQFGPDGRLYIAQQNGLIVVLGVLRTGPGGYEVTSTEKIGLVKHIPNHSDDGTEFVGEELRQVTGLLVTGTSDAPVIYVTSSDYRIGAGAGGSDMNLDTNSGIISRLTHNGSGWEKVDLVRGLPRSEENHSQNGMALDETTNTLYVASGGSTNAGAPSVNFVFSTEYALSAAILSVDLDAINAMPILEPGAQQYIYDLPTLDDPTRPNSGPNGSDLHDPFGGNDGLNQAKIVPGGPVQIHSSGYRNPYDVVITQGGKMYTIDNGANIGWGGHPEGDGTANCTNQYLPDEPGSTGPGPGGDAKVNNLDNLHLVTPGFYAGHPVPVRGNPQGAGLYTHDGANGVWRTNATGDFPLPVDWPPVPTADPQQCDFRNGGVDDGALLTFVESTNGLAEYTAGNFEGAMAGDLVTASFDGSIHRIALNDSGTTATQEVIASGLSYSLDLIAQPATGPFPGTVWITNLGNNEITILEPSDYDGTDTNVCLGTDDPNLDEDDDGYSNADEIDNGTNPCSGADKPADNDGDLLSDLNDADDDDDGLNDLIDPFAIDSDNGLSTELPLFYPFFNADPGVGFFGLGFTGLMSNGTADYHTFFADAENNVTGGGTSGLLTIDDVQSGDALGTQNNQMHAFQFGINVTNEAPPFTVRVQTITPFFSNQPTGEQSQGLFFGTGDQDNYLKLAVHANEGVGGIQILQEAGALVTNHHVFPVAGLLAATEVDLMLTVYPEMGLAQPSIRMDNGEPIPLGSLLALGADVLAALQSPNRALAVGVIATTAGAPAFTASWDEIEISVAENQPPQLIAPATLSISEGETVSVTVTISDLDGDTMSLTANQLPGDAAFVNQNDGNWLLSWETDFEDAGRYEILFEAQDSGGNRSTHRLEINVLNLNRSPVMDTFEPTSAVVGDRLTQSLIATDPDGDPLSLTLDAGSTSAELVDQGNGQGVITWSTEGMEAGTYLLLTTATDDSGASVSTEWRVTLASKPQPPSLEPIESLAISEVSGDSPFTQTFIATAPDGLMLSLTVEGAPAGTIWHDRGNGSATLIWTIAVLNGIYDLTVTVTGENSLSTTESFQVTMARINQAPIGISGPPDDTLPDADPPTIIEERLTFQAGQIVSRTVSFIDPDGEPLTLMLEGDDLPPGTAFIDNGDGTGLLIWQTAESTLDAYTFVITATDLHGLTSQTRIIMEVEAIPDIYLPIYVANYTAVDLETVVFFSLTRETKLRFSNGAEYSRWLSNYSEVRTDTLKNVT